MKRRDFFKIGSLAIPAAALAQSHENEKPYCYPVPKNLKDVETKEQQTLVRVKFSGMQNKIMANLAGRVKVENAEVVAVTPHSFESVDDVFEPNQFKFQLCAIQKKADILVLRLKQVNAESLVRIHTDSEIIAFKLSDILKNGYLQYQVEDMRIDVNFLLDKEIGEISLADIGVKANPEQFSFHIFADPQGGDPTSLANHPTRMKIHNAFIEDSIILSNNLPQRPLFSLILGDIVDSQGEQENFDAMHKFWQELDSPILYELGNHESRYASTFEPGYDMSALSNYFSAQKKINGLDKLLYSFNVGKWHFVVWPDPLRSYFWDNHPHYFEWLERDLQKYRDRPTFVFQHVPCHPMGIDPFQGYLDYVSIRKKYMNIVTKFGNVKYVISGHVHAPVKSSQKTACSINGTNFITLPAAGYRPRGFGEQDYFGGPSQGIAIVSINGSKADVKFKTVMEEELVYPQHLPKMDMDLYKLWFNEKWEIQADKKIKNTDFSDGLTGWIPEYVYKEDENPSVVCEPRTIDNRSALYLYNRVRGYQAPGQDRLPQTINRICTVVKNKAGAAPLVQFQYKLDKENCDLDGRCGGYVWIEGFSKSFRQFNLVYSANRVYANPIANSKNKNYDIHHFDLPTNFDWTQVDLNIKNDFNASEKDRSFDELNVDRIVMTCGVWTLNEGSAQSFGIYFTDFQINFWKNLVSANSVVDKMPIQTKPQEQVWWQGKHIPFIHLAGEHRYHLATAEKTLFTKERERFRK